MSQPDSAYSVSFIDCFFRLHVSKNLTGDGSNQSDVMFDEAASIRTSLTSDIFSGRAMPYALMMETGCFDDGLKVF